MALESGTKLGHYEITDQIGKGGMGEVYRARDTKLGREVAIKVLPSEFSRDEERLARLEREARMLATLNHPNIAAIHGLEESGQTRFLVLELVEGDTLADRLKRGAVPVEESLKLAVQIAEALEAAHEKGVIHRDLKPANIKITRDGRVKVLDFGLAKAFVRDSGNVNLSNSPTLSMQATQAGNILGTAAYMSPEQAKGREVDKRTDIWAFGCVLSEVLTGRPAFDGEDVSEVLASVIKGTMDLDRLPANLHPGIRRIVSRCLTKDPGQRFQDIGDVRLELDEILSGGGALVRTGAPQVAPRPSKLSLIAAVALAALVASVVTGLLTRQDPPQVIRFPYELPADQDFQIRSVSLVAFSPDGTRFAYNTTEGLYLRTLAGEEALLLAGSDASVRNPVFSPDGEWIAYYASGKGQIQKVAVSGGAPTPLAGTSFPHGISWAENGTILFSNQADVLQVSENGGTPKVVIDGRDDERIYGPQLLPGGDWVLFSSTTASGPDRWDEGAVVAQSISTGDRRVLIEGGSDGKYLPTGHLVYAREDALYAIGFDASSLEVVGGATSVVEGIERANSPSTNSGTGHFSVSDTGNLVYVQAGSALADERTLAIVDRDGRMTYLDIPTNQYVAPRFSPDGERLAVQTSGDRDLIWTYDLSGRNAIQRFAVEGNNYRPIWTPFGDRIAFASNREGPISIYIQNADGSGVAERLTTAEEGTAHWPEAFSPDGRTLVYKLERSDDGVWSLSSNEMDLWMVSLDDPQAPEPVAAEPYPVQEHSAAFSPKGDWLAYTVGDGLTLEYEIWARPFPLTGEIRQISAELGVMPLWSNDGAELFYRPVTVTSGMRQTLRSIRVSTTPSLEFSSEAIVDIGNFLSFAYYRSFDITPDGGRFVVVLPGDQSSGSTTPRPQIHVVLNWFEELKERVPVP